MKIPLNVLEAIESELAFQEYLQEEGAISEDEASFDNLGRHLLVMESYLHSARETYSRFSRNREAAVRNDLRIVASLAVRAMSVHGVELRAPVKRKKASPYRKNFVPGVTPEPIDDSKSCSYPSAKILELLAHGPQTRDQIVEYTSEHSYDAVRGALLGLIQEERIRPLANGHIELVPRGEKTGLGFGG